MWNTKYLATCVERSLRGVFEADRWLASPFDALAEADRWLAGDAVAEADCWLASQFDSVAEAHRWLASQFISRDRVVGHCFLWGRVWKCG